MSIMYCEKCNKNIDTDNDVEHFNDDGECVYNEEDNI